MPSVIHIASFVLMLFPVIHGWGEDGHFIVCRIAEARLSKRAVKAVSELLSGYSSGDLASHCSWADHVRFRYRWSDPLHYIDTPDDLCSYQHQRDCKDENGEKDFCVSGAITNYSNQLLAYGKSPARSQYDLTEALMFFSHFIGDIHQPLHVGFTSDRGANTINVHWYRKKSVLHHVWDSDIIETAEGDFYNRSVENLIGAIQQNITGDWADEVATWEMCGHHDAVCPDIYASESIIAACKWAYNGVSEGSVLGDDYFISRLPVVNVRLAQAGVRLASALNRIFV